ncbi:MAG: zinc-dependent metalloprotease [Chitinophagales bacterium]|nr:zinc-dependent metalloprotease [Bacteroidota bacterium]MCB9042677.1 T9SS type A sorting domain-containing protein [Chitinophagales bacterium]
MDKKWLLLNSIFIVGLIFCWQSAHAQVQVLHRCGSVEALRFQAKENPQYAKNYEQLAQISPQKKAIQETVELPIVVHVLHNNVDGSLGNNNISEAQIQSQIQRLNTDFSATNGDLPEVPTQFQSVLSGDTEIRFCLAKIAPDGSETTGITRTYTTKTSFSHLDNDCKSAATGGVDAWDPCSYINIWVVPALDEGELLGYAQFPGAGADETDGLVIAHYVFGDETGTAVNGNFTMGRTLTHEMAHYFGLRHIWGDDGGSCAGSDNIDDTPNQGDATIGCPNQVLNSCGSDDMTMNFLDYSYDVCLLMFTQLQAAFMQNVLQTHNKRACLLESANYLCQGFNAPCTADYGVVAFPNNLNVCSEAKNKIVQVFNANTDNHETLFLLTAEPLHQIIAYAEQGQFSFEGLNQGKFGIVPLNILSYQKNNLLELINFNQTTLSELISAAQTNNLCIDIMQTNYPTFTHLSPLSLNVTTNCLSNNQGNPTGWGIVSVTVSGGLPPYTFSGTATNSLLSEGSNISVSVKDNANCSSAYEGVIDCINTGIAMVEKTDFSLYPNPTNAENTYLRLPANTVVSRLEIRSSSGQIFPVNWQTTSSNTLVFGAATLGAGVYFLQIETNEQEIFYQKLLVL